MNEQAVVHRDETISSATGAKPPPLRVSGLFNDRWYSLKEVATTQEGVALIYALPEILAQLAWDIDICEETAPTNFGFGGRSKDRYRLLGELWSSRAQNKGVHSAGAEYRSRRLRREDRARAKAAFAIDTVRSKYCPILFGSRLRALSKLQPTQYRIRQAPYLTYLAMVHTVASLPLVRAA